MITKEELDAMSARCDAATPGPWIVNRRAELLGDEDIEDAEVCAYGDTILIALNSGGNHKGNVAFTAHARTDEPRLIARVRELEAEVSRYSRASDRSEWSEDDGDVLWWRFPIEEPPYAGTPLDDNFPDYVTHWTRIAIPVATPGATKPARLDADRTAKLLTEIVAVVAPNVDGVCRSMVDSAERYVVRPTAILSVKDPTAQDLLWEYAQRRRAVDAEFADDLETALRIAGYAPAHEVATGRVRAVDRDACTARVAFDKSNGAAWARLVCSESAYVRGVVRERKDGGE